MDENLSAWLTLCQDRVNHFLSDWLPKETNAAAGRLFQAIRYSALQGGKRLRPALVYAASELGHRTIDEVLPLGVAVECIHAYSLIHDDLPAMDNDHLRRGQPTCHIAYDEATAILVGDALQAAAFEILASADVPNLTTEMHLRMIQALARAAGTKGMVAGQAMDIMAQKVGSNLSELARLHDLKTGALLCVSVEIGALAATLEQDETDALIKYGKALGRAFQVTDDCLDATTSTEVLGKPQHSDARSGKVTYVSLLGLAGAQKEAKRLEEEALEALSDFGEPADRLRALVRFATQRKA